MITLPKIGSFWFDAELETYIVMVTGTEKNGHILFKTLSEMQWEKNYQDNPTSNTYATPVAEEYVEVIEEWYTRYIELSKQDLIKLKLKDQL